jgi:GNAT superfamily N-acetyltransferase
VTEVRPAGRSDVGALSSLLARAFFDDPVAAYLFPKPSWRAVVLPRFFTLQLRHNYLPRGEVLTTTARSGAAFVMPPFPREPRLVDRLAHIGFLPLMGRRVTATHLLTEALESRRPADPHCYLGTIGTDPVHQRRGVGSALVGSITRRCDEDGVPIYLECSRPETIAFYARFGFEVRDVVEAPATGVLGPRLYLMWREAKL